MIKFSNLAALSSIKHGITEAGDKQPADLIRGEQIHKDTIALVKDNSVAVIPRADALVTKQAGITLGVYTADCVPIVFADPGAKAIGTIHAGWRGTALDITRKTIDFLKIRPFKLQVGIGPAICPDCFEVGNEVANQFDKSLVKPSATDEEKSYVDLWQANVNQCIEAGVPERNIEVIRRCTNEDESLHSYRRSGGTKERNVAFISRR